jgi:hypothetical protein
MRHSPCNELEQENKHQRDIEKKKMVYHEIRTQIQLKIMNVVLCFWYTMKSKITEYCYITILLFCFSITILLTHHMRHSPCNELEQENKYQRDIEKKNGLP